MAQSVRASVLQTESCGLESHPVLAPVFDPAPIAQFFRFDSGIRLRRTKKLAIEAGPTPRLPVDGPRSHNEKCHLASRYATFVAARGTNGPDAPPNRACEQEFAIDAALQVEP